MSTRKPPQKKESNSAVYLSRGLQEIILAEALTPSASPFDSSNTSHSHCLLTTDTSTTTTTTTTAPDIPTTLRQPISLKEGLAIIEQRQCTSVEFYLKAMWQRLQV